MSLNKFTIQKSFAISAGGWSGKTYTLSRRYINALLGFDYFREDYQTQKPNRKTNLKEYNFANLCKDAENETYNSEYKENLKKLIFDTKENIESGKFGFDNGDEKMCGWCDIKHICHESNINKVKKGNI